MPIKYLGNFLRSLEMPLINGKIELKFIQKNYCVLSAAGADNRNANPNSTVFIIKDTKLQRVSSRDNKKLSNFLAKDLKDQFIAMNIKQ